MNITCVHTGSIIENNSKTVLARRFKQNNSGQTNHHIELQNTNQLLLEFVNHSTANKCEKKHQTLKKDSVASKQSECTMC